jgi:hypothetical protein
MIIYDIEIQSAIPPKDGAPMVEGVKYCKGFDDFEMMGIAVIGVHDYVADENRLFTEYELDDFKQLVAEHDVYVGFNNKGFDNKLLAANGVNLPESRCYDILEEIWKSLGQRQSGCRLEDVARTNFGAGKNGDGAKAPILWQKGYHGKVHDYCLNDVRLTKKILDRILRRGWIVNPVNPEKILWLPRPNRKF